VTDKVWDVEQWRAEFTRNKDVEQKKIYNHMQRLTREIFAAALVKHHSMDEAIMAVYLTGLYHATELAKSKT
jgi:hypothetical protein